MVMTRPSSNCTIGFPLPSPIPTGRLGKFDKPLLPCVAPRMAATISRISIASVTIVKSDVGLPAGKLGTEGVPGVEGSGRDGRDGVARVGRLPERLPGIGRPVGTEIGRLLLRFPY